MLLKVGIDQSQPQYFISTEVDMNTLWRQVSSWTHVVHQKRHMPGGKNKLERDFQIVKCEQINSNIHMYVLQKQTDKRI